jgi:putative flippase GtrA
MISSETAARMFRYLFAGGTAAVIDLSIFTVLHVAVGLAVPVAATGSFCFAAVVNYVISSLFVFRHPLALRQLAVFVAVAAVGMVINVAVTTGVNATGLFGALLDQLSDRIGRPGLIAPYAAVPAKVCGIGSAFLLNFYLNNTFVFRSRADAPPVSPGSA